MTKRRAVACIHLLDLAKAAGMTTIAFALGLPGAITGASAAEPDWPAGTYKYITVDQPVAEALAEFGRNIRIPVSVSPAVKGRLSAGKAFGNARQFLLTICDQYRLVWHFDGITLNIATEAEVQTEILKIGKAEAATAVEKLKASGVIDQRFPVDVSRRDDVVSVSGPPSYIALVKRTLGATSVGDPGRQIEVSEVAQVRVFRGKQAETLSVPAGGSK